MKISLTPAAPNGLKELADLAPLAEGLGYHALWRAEGVAWDAFTVCGLWAERTRTLQVATGIVSAITRHPGALARAAATLQELSKGRFRLGLGVGNNPEVPQPASPLKAMEEVVGAVRGHWRDGLVPNVSQPAPSIWLAALRPKMVALSGRIADGVILNWVTPEQVVAVRQQLGPDYRIACFVRAMAADAKTALGALAENLTFYAALDVYRKSLESQGLAPDAMPEQDALRLIIRGRDDFARWREAGVDELVLRPMGADQTATMMQLAPGG